MAVRNIPHAVEYARLIAREAPHAWVVNFTNPVGIVTQAMTAADTRPGDRDLRHADGTIRGRRARAGCRVVSLLLRLLRPQPSRLAARGVPRRRAAAVAACGSDPELLRRIYRAPLFDVAFLQSLRLLPTEYLFYYYSHDAALANMRKAGQTRGRSDRPAQRSAVSRSVASRRGSSSRLRAVPRGAQRRLHADRIGRLSNRSSARPGPSSRDTTRSR